MKPRSFLGRLAAPFSVALAAAIAYSTTLRAPAVLDDFWVIFDNSLVKHLSNIPRLFREPFSANGESGPAGFFRPVAAVTYALNYAAGGSNVIGYHLVNIALHIACSLLVLALVRHLVVATGARDRAGAVAWVSALFFAVHPAHVEAVTGLVGRADLLATAGALLCLYLFCTRARGRWRLPLGLVSLALGVLSKENSAAAVPLFALIAVALPTAAGLDDRPGFASPAGRRSLVRLAGLEAAMAAAATVYFVLKAIGPGGAGIPPSAQYFNGQPPSVVFNTMTRALAEYLRILVWPDPLGLDFYYRSMVPMTFTFSTASLVATAAWGGILTAGLVALRRRPLIAVGVLWIFVALLPVLNIIPIGTVMAERLLYLPSAGFCLLAGAALVLGPGALTSRFPRLSPMAFRSVACALGAVVLAALGAKTLARNAEWNSALSLWRAEVAKVPGDPVAQNNLAVELLGIGDTAGAREASKAAIAADPGYWLAHMNLGTAYLNGGDPQSAVHEFETAIRLAPSAPDPLIRLGKLHLDQGRLDQALPLFEHAAEVAPEYAPGCLWTGIGRYLAGRPQLASAALSRATHLDPTSAMAHAYLALIAFRSGNQETAAGEAALFPYPLEGVALLNGERLKRGGRLRDAAEEFRLAIDLNPRSSRAMFELGRCLEALGNPAGAVESYERAFSLSPGNRDVRIALERARKAIHHP